MSFYVFSFILEYKDTYMVRVLIADDHQKFMDGLKSMLEQTIGMDVVGEAINGKEVLKCYNEKDVDIVMMDVRMPSFALTPLQIVVLLGLCF